MKLYSYFRSSAAYRVRIALNFKNVAYDMVPIHMQKDGGRHKSAEYRAINPQMRVPALELPGGEVLVQSLAVINYLEEAFPEPPLLPPDARSRAHVRAVADIVACDIHPLNNLAPLNYLRDPLKQEQEAVRAWYHHWILEGFAAIEKMINPGPYTFGSAVTLAVHGMRPMTASIATDFPEPDSPTIAWTAPASTVSDRWSTARKAPRSVAKSTVRFSISKAG